MHLLCLAAALTFSALPDGEPEFLAPEFDLEQVEAEDTPGSAEWYLPVERLKLPVTWRITRNGRAVTNDHGSVRISLAPTTGLWPDDRWHDLNVRDWYCGYDVDDADYVRIPNESDPEPQYFNLASPEMFYLSWNTHVASTNYHYTALACSNDDYYVSALYADRELFKPKSSRLDSVSRSALLGSYEAYYERLYYASQGQRNEWEIEDWGETSDPKQFNFSPSNLFVRTTPRFHPSYPTNDFEKAEDGPLRPIPASRRMTDAENIAEFLGQVRSIFPPELTVLPPASAGGRLDYNIYDARPFVFRPHWLSDANDYAGDSFGSRLWWASTVPPPAMTQVVWGTDHEIVSSALGLFPEIRDFRPLDELWAEGVPFACYAVTLDMLADGDGFECDGSSSTPPCLELFRAVLSDCPSAHDWMIDEITPFDFGDMTVPGFLTNCYPRAAASVPNRSDAYDRYVDVGTDTTAIRRMVPGRLDLVNQLLSVMDRTIAIPSMRITSTNTVKTAVNSCKYAAEPVTVEATWNGSDWEVSGFAQEYTLSGAPQMNVEESTNVVLGIQLAVSSSSTDVEPGVDGYEQEGLIFITEDWMRSHLPGPSTSVVESIQAANMGVVLHGSFGDLFVGIDGLGRYDPITFEATPSAFASRRYSWQEPESVGRIGLALGPYQPGFEADDRAADCQCAFLDTLATPYSYNKWRSQIDDYDDGDLPAKLQSHVDSCLGLLRAHALRDCAGYNVPDDYIPLPSSVRLKLDDEEEPYVYVNGFFDIQPLYPEGRDGTNIIYRFTLPVPGETASVYRDDNIVTNAVLTDYYWDVRIDHVFDTNWVETTTVVSNAMSVHHYLGSYSEYIKGEPIVVEIDFPDPPVVDLVFTNRHPSEVELTGMAVTNLEVTTWYNAYETVYNHYYIIESYVYEADHTRDWYDSRYERDDGHDEYFWIPEERTNSTTSVELTVTNSLPDDAIASRTEKVVEYEPAELVLVRSGEDECFVYVVYTNPLTGEKSWVVQELPYPVAFYELGLDIIFLGDVDGFDDEHDPFDESIFFRVMTQVDWDWNYMKLEKENQ